MKCKKCGNESYDSSYCADCRINFVAKRKQIAQELKHKYPKITKDNIEQYKAKFRKLEKEKL